MRQIQIQIILMALLLCSCSAKNNAEQQGDVTDSAITMPIDKESLAAEVQKRVAAMYDDVFDHYNRDDFDSWSSHDLYFSDSLKSLWSLLPHDEEVIEVDPWTWTQDYDTLAYNSIDVTMLSEHTAQAIVALPLWKNSEHAVLLELVREKHSDSSASFNWYVNDTKNWEHKGWPSIADEIRDYIREFKQN